MVGAKGTVIEIKSAAGQTKAKGTLNRVLDLNDVSLEFKKESGNDADFEKAEYTLFLGGRPHDAGARTVDASYDWSKKQCTNDMEDPHTNHTNHPQEHDIDIVVDQQKQLKHNMLRVTMADKTQRIYVQKKLPEVDVDATETPYYLFMMLDQNGVVQARSIAGAISTVHYGFVQPADNKIILSEVAFDTITSANALMRQ